MNDAKPTFGFDRLSEFQPEPARPPSKTSTQPRSREKPARADPDPGITDAPAERLGFTSREATRRRKRSVANEPSDQFGIRASIPDINRFVEWCEENRYTYREGFAELVKFIDLPRR